MTAEEILDKIRQGAAKWLVMGFSVAFVAAIIFSVLRIGFVIGLYNYFAQWVTVHLGFDYYLANLTGVLMAAAMTLILPSILWYLIAGRKKAQAVTAIAGSMAVICVLIYTVGQDVYFNRTTGAPLRYYADTAGGQRVFSFTPGFDPKTGKKFEPYTSEIAASGSKNAVEPLKTSKPKISFSKSVYTTFSYGSDRFRVQLLEFFYDPEIYAVNSRGSYNPKLKISICNESGNNSYFYGPQFVYTQSTDQSSLKLHYGERLNFQIGECKVITAAASSYSGDFRFTKPLGTLYINDNASLLSSMDLSDFTEDTQFQ